jgi:hypothetical protein
MSCVIPESRVTKAQRAYALSVELQHPALTSIHDSEVPTTSEMARCLMVGHYPSDFDYVDRLGIWNQLVKGISPEEIIASKSKWQGGKFGLIYEYRSSDLGGQVVYVGFTTAPLKRRMYGHNGCNGYDRFDNTIRSGLTTTCSVVGIGTLEDEERRIAARVVQGHPLLNEKYNPVRGFDFFASGESNVVLFMGEAIERIWNRKTMTMTSKTLNMKEQPCLARTLAAHHIRNKRRILLDHSQSSNKTSMLSYTKAQRADLYYEVQLARFENIPLVELPCSVCGTLGVTLEKNARKRPLIHAFSECCGVLATTLYFPEQRCQGFPIVRLSKE